MGIFKTYDIRGIVPNNLNESIMYKIGRATAKLLSVSKIIVGRDARLSSDDLFYAYTKGLTDEGVSVVNAGLITTPLLYFAVGHYNISAGTMITASHNPKSYNGLKIVKNGVVPLSSNEIQELKSIVDTHPEWKYVSSDHKTISFASLPTLLDDYRNHLNSIINLNSLPPYNIIVDCANGAGAVAFTTVFRSLSQKISGRNMDPDGNFPAHEPNPLIEENRIDLINEMKLGDYDVGVAFDGDADRCFFFDENGTFIPGDFMTALLARELLALYPKSEIVYDLRSSWAVKDIIEENGGTSHMIKVGHVFFKEAMRKYSAIFAGEITGHYYFKDNFYAEDGILPVLLVLRMMSRLGKTLSEICKEFKNYYLSGESNYTVSNADEKIKLLEETYKNKAKLSYIDGISIDADDWHCNVRKSNTEPLLRLNVEAKSKEKLAIILAEIETLIKN